MDPERFLLLDPTAHDDHAPFFGTKALHLNGKAIASVDECAVSGPAISSISTEVQGQEPERVTRRTQDSSQVGFFFRYYLVCHRSFAVSLDF